ESSTGIWAKLRAGLDTDEFDSRQPAFVAQLTTYDSVLGPERKISDHLFYRWQPLVDWHFNPLEFEAVSPVFGNIGRVATFAIVGLLVLLVGCSNSISLSLAEAIERRREIGVRKAAGAMPKDILREQLGTSLLRA